MTISRRSGLPFQSGISSFLAICFLAACMVCAPVDGYADELEKSFTTPPASARPWVYWFWVNGSITKEGITADLEAMEKVGIGGALIMHVSAGIPAGPVKFFSQEWRDLFKHAVAEADRLGLEITMNACDGWTGTGGPWIKPEEAMVKLVWTKTNVEGPLSSSRTLDKPAVNFGVYSDVAVLAFPALKSEVPAQQPRVTCNDSGCEVQKLADGDFETAAIVNQATDHFQMQFQFDKPFTARGICVAAPEQHLLRKPRTAIVESSEDGKNFKPVCKVKLKYHSNIATVTAAFDDVTAAFFRVTIPEDRGQLTEITLLNEGLINAWELKAGYARSWGHGADERFFAMQKSALSDDESFLTPSWAGPDSAFVVDPGRILDLTDCLEDSGRLNWKVPPGKWTILRIGYTPSGEKNGPASIEGTGLEPDALNPSGIEASFSRFTGKLLEDIGPLAGKTMRYSHIDSWETGQQNWTADFPKEFKKRRGYDLTRYLPVMAGGHIVGSVDLSERFLWDVRRTVADMLADYYYGQMAKVCHQNGLGFESEAAGASQFLYDPITFQSQVDIPMGEFWTSENRIRPDCKAAASAANIFGKKFVGAESFTSKPETAKWTQHPYTLKVLGDEAFCVGINRFVFHRYAMQPWLNVRPGMTMGQWGIHFERTNTWWQQGKAWMHYLARCQSLLQQGQFVADVLYFTGEGAPNYLCGDPSEMNPPLPDGYDFDACNADVLLNRVSVRDGRIVLNNGRQYRLLLLADDRTMSPGLLKKIRKLVKAGAVVIGPKPLSSPSLTDFPGCDQDVKKIANEVWGEEGLAKVERSVGKGRVLWGLSFEEIFEKLDTAADFEHTLPQGSLEYIHRRDDNADWYFVSNQTYLPVESTCAFRTAGRRVELWNPQTGTLEKPAVFKQERGRTCLPIRLESAESVFVVFRKPCSTNGLLNVKRDDKPIMSTDLSPGQPHRTGRTVPDYEFGKSVGKRYPDVKESFTVAFWAKPTTSIVLPRQADKGISGTGGQNFVTLTEQGQIAYGVGHASAGVSIGTNGICLFEHSAGYFPARIVHKMKITDWVHVAVVYDRNCPSLYVNGVKTVSASPSRFTVHPCGVQAPTPNMPAGVSNFSIIPTGLSADAIAALAKQPPAAGFNDMPFIEISETQTGGLSAIAWQSGRYTVTSANGQTTELPEVKIDAPLPVTGPWQVSFEKMAAPESVMFEQLISWTEHEMDSIKYFSGTATYRKTLDLPTSLLDKNRRLFLDLGNVQVIAEVRMNGRDLGILWKPPFRVDLTDALRAGENQLEIRITNLWPNRLIGDEQWPPDSDYNKGRLTQWPRWITAGKPRPQSQRQTFATWDHYGKQSPLMDSGLLGPVMIRSAQIVLADFEN